MKRAWLVICILFLGHCTEAPIITSHGLEGLNSPSSIVLVPGTSLAIVANANINLDERWGWLMAVDLDSNELLLDTKTEIPNFSGIMYLDADRKQLYIPDHDESLLVYEYKIPGDGGSAISFSPVEVGEPAETENGFIENGVQTDDGSTQALMVPGPSGDLILVTNQVGSISMISPSSLKAYDMDAEDKYYGLRLFSAINFQDAEGDKFPAPGASRMAVSPTTGLVYISSPINNQIYVLDPVDETVEAMINLDSLSAPVVGIREIVIDSNDVAYIAHSGLDSIIVLDVSGITNNGIDYEVVAPPILGMIPVGDGPEDLELNLAENRLFVSNQNEDSIYMIDVPSQTILTKTYLDEGKAPGRMILDETRNTLYCLNTFSNSITRIDATTGERLGDIE